LNPSIIAEREMDFREGFSEGISGLETFDFEVVQSTPEMFMYPCFGLLPKRLSVLKVVCGTKMISWIPLF
jgi:hypothetical protein